MDVDVLGCRVAGTGVLRSAADQGGAAAWAATAVPPSRQACGPTTCARSARLPRDGALRHPFGAMRSMGTAPEHPGTTRQTRRDCLLIRFVRMKTIRQPPRPEFASDDSLVQSTSARACDEWRGARSQRHRAARRDARTSCIARSLCCPVSVVCCDHGA